MEGNDIDFTRAQSSSSNLASLFGFGKQSLKGNSSLTYTAPKAPKRPSSPQKNVEEKPNKGVIMCSKAVFAYKGNYKGSTADGSTYLEQGLCGIVINGNHESHHYLIILYKTSKHPLIIVTIKKNTLIFVAENNYMSFIDHNKEFWSVRFETTADIEEFLEKVAISKFYSNFSNAIIIEDLKPDKGPEPSIRATVDTNNIVHVTYSRYGLQEGATYLIKENVEAKVDLRQPSPLGWGLMGCTQYSKRIVVVPRPMTDSWAFDLEPNNDLIFNVSVIKVVPKAESSSSKSKSQLECSEKPTESSTEDTSTIAKETSLKEALENSKSQKANLISRMARMGQATLPLKQGDGPSDSEEESSVSLPKTRIARNRSSGSSGHQISNPHSYQSGAKDAVNQLSPYQNDLSIQPLHLSKLGMQHQVMPISTSPTVSPMTDTNLSVYVSESRIQATELRMGISKISDKLDIILNKIQDLNCTGTAEVKTSLPRLIESSSILSGVQNLITENEKLRGQVEDQKTKLECQNDKMFQLLELNHKYLEQNSASIGKQSDKDENSLKELEMELERKKGELETETRKHLEKVRALEEELLKAKESRKKTEEMRQELITELDNCKKNMEGNSNMKEVVENYDEKLTRLSEIVTKLKAKLKSVVAENEELKLINETQKNNIEKAQIEQKDAKIQNEAHEKTVESLKNEMMGNESKYKETMLNLKDSVKKLEEEKSQCLAELNKIKESQKIEMEKVLNQILLDLKANFSDSSEYTTSRILSAIDKCFCNYLGNDIPTVCTKVEDVPAPRNGTQNLDSIKDQISDNALEDDNDKIISKPENENLAKTKKNEDSSESGTGDSNPIESNSRYKSYDQGWRTTKPPPPPLFDDEDDDDSWLN